MVVVKTLSRRLFLGRHLGLIQSTLCATLIFNKYRWRATREYQNFKLNT